MSRRLWSLTAAALTLLSGSRAAAYEPAGEYGISGNEIVVTARVRPEPRPPRYDVVRVPAGRCYRDGAGRPRWPSDAAGSGQDRPGRMYLERLVDRRTGKTIRGETICVLPTDRATASPPAPPSPAELSDSVRLPTTRSNWSPTRALTGLETYIWASSESSKPVTAAASVRGWTAALTVRPVEFVWRIDGPDGTVEFRSAEAGSPCRDRSCRDEAAAVRTFETKGDYTVETTIVWRGGFTLAGHGMTLRSEDVGPYRTTASETIVVDEIRSILTSRPPSGPTLS